jgi:hypothetical protein
LNRLRLELPDPESFLPRQQHKGRDTSAVLPSMGSRQGANIIVAGPNFFHTVVQCGHPIVHDQ